MAISRRKFLAASAAAGAVVTAGCGGKVETSPGEASDKDVPAPSVNVPDGWELTTPNSESVVFDKGEDFGINWTAVGHTNLYENVKLRNRIKEETFGRINRQLMVGFASRIDFFPTYAHLGTGFKQDTIDSQIRSKMQSQMKGFGLKEITYQGESQRMGSSNPSSYHKWTGKYPIEEISIEDVNIPHVEKDSFTIGGEDLEIAGIAAVWKEGTHLLAAGGVYPAERYSEREKWDVSGAVHLSLQIEMGFRPNLYDRQIKSIMDSTNP